MSCSHYDVCVDLHVSYRNLICVARWILAVHMSSFLCSWTHSSWNERHSLSPITFAPVLLSYHFWNPFSSFGFCRVSSSTLWRRTLNHAWHGSSVSEWMPFLLLNQQCQSTHSSHSLLHPLLNGWLSDTHTVLH